MSNEPKSAILASIADAETYGRRQREYGFDETATRVEQTATAARAEHAEMVEVMKAIRTPHLLHGQVKGTRVTFDFCCHENAQNFMLAHNTLDTLLSRVGGGS